MKTRRVWSRQLSTHRPSLSGLQSRDTMGCEESTLRAEQSRGEKRREEERRAEKENRAEEKRAEQKTGEGGGHRAEETGGNREATQQGGYAVTESIACFVQHAEQ